MFNTEFDQTRAERLIVHLRIENRGLKSRIDDMKRMSAQELPASWEKRLRKLRDENVRMRRERNESRAELEALRTSISAV